MLTVNTESFYKKFPAFHLVNEVKELAKPLFQSINANYFDYCRFYEDNSFFTLTTDCLWLEHFFKKRYTLAAAVKDSGKHLWHSINYNTIIHDARAYYNHDHGISIFYKKGNYIEYIDIAASKNNPEITSLYLNNFDILENFINQFVEKAENLILQAESNLVLIPTEMTGIKKTDPDITISPMHSLTPREQQCLKGFLMGQTAKETANEFEISARTVEQHMNSVRMKFKCNRKRDLIKLFMSVCESK